MFCPASPPLDQSILKQSLTTYRLGSKFLCKSLPSGESATGVISWKDKDSIFHLVDHDGTIQETESPCENLIYQAGTSSAVWQLARSNLQSQDLDSRNGTGKRYDRVR
ncbi:hypothetical protein BJX99DRAFT_237054 [Aspergillus californicus]